MPEDTWMPATITRRPYVHCPHCGQMDATVDHLKPGTSFGIWYCDHCGKGYGGQVAADGSIQLAKLERACVPTLVRLQLQLPPGHVLLLAVKGFRFETDDEADPVNDRYFYEEHTCPANSFRQVESVFLVSPDGTVDNDPHGILRWQQTTDVSMIEKESA